MDNLPSGNQDETNRALVTFYIPLLAMVASSLPAFFVLVRLTEPAQFLLEFAFFFIFALWLLWCTLAGETRLPVYASILFCGILPFALIIASAKVGPWASLHGIALLLFSAAAWAPALIVREVARGPLEILQNKPLDLSKGALKSPVISTVAPLLVVGTLIFVAGSYQGEGTPVDLFVVAFFAVPFYLCSFALLSLAKLLRKTHEIPGQPMVISADFARRWVAGALTILAVGALLATLLPHSPLRLLNALQQRTPRESPFIARRPAEHGDEPYTSQRSSRPNSSRRPPSTPSTSPGGRGNPHPNRQPSNNHPNSRPQQPPRDNSNRRQPNQQQRPNQNPGQPQPGKDGHPGNRNSSNPQGNGKPGERGNPSQKPGPGDSKSNEPGKENDQQNSGKSQDGKPGQSSSPDNKQSGDQSKENKPSDNQQQNEKPQPAKPRESWLRRLWLNVENFALDVAHYVVHLGEPGEHQSGALWQPRPAFALAQMVPWPGPTPQPTQQEINAKATHLRQDIRENPWRLVKLIVIGLLLVLNFVLLGRWAFRSARERLARKGEATPSPRRNPFDDPFETMPGAAPDALAAASYETFLAYCWLANTPRKPEQTEHDFALRLETGTPFDSNAVWTITRHCTRAGYANEPLTDDELNELHTALKALMQQTTVHLTEEALKEKKEAFLDMQSRRA